MPKKTFASALPAAARGLDLSPVRQATARHGCVTSRKLEPAGRVTGRRVAGGHCAVERQSLCVMPEQKWALPAPARGLDLSPVKQATARQGCITSAKLEPAGHRVAGGLR